MRAISSEQAMFFDFKKELVRFQNVRSDIECAIIAQHFGLPTRLLDWTTNPLVALHFAINSKSDSDACVYLLSFSIESISEEDVNYTALFPNIIFDIEVSNENSSSASFRQERHPEQNEPYPQYFSLEPSSTTERIVAQKSFFTLHYDPFSPIEKEVHGKLIIPHDLKKRMKEALQLFGVTSYTLFPDIGGLATSLKQAYFSNILAE